MGNGGYGSWWANPGNRKAAYGTGGGLLCFLIYLLFLIFG